MKQAKTDKHLVAILWIVVGALARLIPHPPNFSPTTSIALFGGTQMNRWLGLAITLAGLALSDLLLVKAAGYPPFGTWSLFSYTGFALIVLAGGWLRKSPTAGRTLAFLLGSSGFYWTWTNFGVWLLDGMYPRSGAGLITCYANALPFLKNALLGDMVWGLVFFASFSFVRRQARVRGWLIQGA